MLGGIEGRRGRVREGDETTEAEGGVTWSQAKEGGSLHRLGKARDASPANARRNTVLVIPSFTALEDF